MKKIFFFGISLVCIFVFFVGLTFFCFCTDYIFEGFVSLIISFFIIFLLFKTFSKFKKEKEKIERKKAREKRKNSLHFCSGLGYVNEETIEDIEEEFYNLKDI